LYRLLEKYQLDQPQPGAGDATPSESGPELKPTN